MELEVFAGDVPHTNCPLVVVVPFLVQNWKVVVGSINQLLITLGGIVKVNRVSLKTYFWPFLLHIHIDFDGRVIFLFLFVISCLWLESGVNQKPIAKEDVNNLGCTKFCFLPKVYFFSLSAVERLHNLECKLLKTT